MTEYLAYLICRLLGYHMSTAMEDGSPLIVTPNGNWDYWRPTSRWTRLLRWHFTSRTKETD